MFPKGLLPIVLAIIMLLIPNAIESHQTSDQIGVYFWTPNNIYHLDGETLNIEVIGHYLPPENGIIIDILKDANSADFIVVEASPRQDSPSEQITNVVLVDVSSGNRDTIWSSNHTILAPSILSPDGEHIIVKQRINTDREVYLIYCLLEIEQRTCEETNIIGSQLQWFDNDTILYLYDGIPRLYDIYTNSQYELNIVNREITHINFHQQNKKLLAYTPSYPAETDVPSFILYDFQTQEFIGISHRPDTALINLMNLSPDGHYFYYTDSTNSSTIVNVQNGTHFPITPEFNQLFWLPNNNGIIGMIENYDSTLHEMYHIPYRQESPEKLQSFTITYPYRTILISQY